MQRGQKGVMTSREPEAGYLQVAGFSGERPASRAYAQLQDVIFRAPACDLSVYRLLLDRQWQVAVLGSPPAELLDRRIRQILARGVPTSLPPEILTTLHRRRAEATRLGPWVEGHHRPT